MAGTFIRFNFPAMIPLWTLPIAIGTGNTLLIKPSERDPGAAAMLVELATMAGVPSGVVSLVHGGPETVNFLCDDPRIKAISFVGSDVAGKHIWDRAGKNGKRVQANLGAKNHAILMPDANKEQALNAIAGAAFGAAGQRCMALSVLITVGDSKEWVQELITRAKGLKVGNGFDEGIDL
jgi:malonate-semialdehyde dehydrogenase (acetylating)/methylmalonate-semialdehyde dehydrogenase